MISSPSIWRRDRSWLVSNASQISLCTSMPGKERHLAESAYGRISKLAQSMMMRMRRTWVIH
jgi:hypothetical protein